MRLGRVIVDRLLISLTFVAFLVALVPLLSILYDVTVNGIGQMNLDFITQLPPLANSPGGGMANAIQGTLLLVATSSAIGIPIGLLSGIYISEFGTNRYGSTLSFLGDVLAGVPSITTGILINLLIVLTFRSYSLIAGSIALGTMMIPIVSNTTSQALKTVPSSIREASHSLGIRKWRTTFLVVANAKTGIATGSLLAIARITGETAPLILTAGISYQWFSGVNQPVGSLTYFIWYFATQPFSNWVNLAWGAALFLIIIVLGINAVVRIITRRSTSFV